MLEAPPSRAHHVRHSCETWLPRTRRSIAACRTDGSLRGGARSNRERKERGAVSEIQGPVNRGDRGGAVENEGQAHEPLAERPVQVEYFCRLFWTSAPIASHSSECPSLFPECSDDWIASIIITRQLKFDPERGHFHGGMRCDHNSPRVSSHTCTCPWASVCHCSADLSPMTGVPSTNWRTQTGPMASGWANFSAMPA